MIFQSYRKGIRGHIYVLLFKLTKNKSTKRFINGLAFLRGMVVVQDRPLRKPSGGRNTSTRPRKLAQKGNNPSMTGIDKTRTRTLRTRGGAKKSALLSTEEVNLFDPKTKKNTKAKLKSVKESAANRNYVRRNIITKGTIVETDKGVAKVTNRPGQDGTINAVLQ